MKKPAPEPEPTYQLTTRVYDGDDILVYHSEIRWIGHSDNVESEKTFAGDSYWTSRFTTDSTNAKGKAMDYAESIGGRAEFEEAGEILPNSMADEPFPFKGANFFS